MCGKGCLVKVTPRAIDITACSCRCWSCEKCAPLRQWRCEQDIIAGEPTTFITLGCRPSRYESPDEARADMGRCFAKLAKRIRRKWPNHEFEYAAFWEAFKSGWPHVHIACRATYLPQKWLSKQWKNLLDAPVVHLRKAGTARQIAKYLCKYLTKQPHQFGKAKRYYYSQGYRSTPVMDDCRKRPPAQIRWVRDPLAVVVAQEMREGAFPIQVNAGRVLLVRQFEQ